MSASMDDIVFVGEWVKERTLGSGSFGIVVLWRHRHSAERLAIKTCRWGSELTAKHRERWTKEVEMLRTCDNENIVGTKELPSEFTTALERANPSGLPILCMEYCSGGDLRQLLNKIESSSGLKEMQVRSILSDIKNAMEFLHKSKITHRDLKPENIVMKISGPPGAEDDPSQSKVIYKLIDLGYAKEIDSNSVCASFVGTLQYLAPELFYSKTYSNSVDFWSFGLLAFEVVCGVRPFLPHMPPVQWMPLVKKKATDHICVFETYHGDVEYSSEVFPENHISAPFKLLLEKWLKISLEYDPKLRGRESSLKGVKFNLPSDGETREADNKFGNVVLFSSLQDILSRKIIKIFSTYNLTMLAYEIDDSVVISTLKQWIERDTKISIDNQVLLSQPVYKNIENSDIVMKYWNDRCGIMIYLYHRDEFMHNNIQPKVPKAIQRCLEQPKALYNYRNSKDLYKSGLYFLMSEKELYDSLITSCLLKAESLKLEGKELFLKHNEVDKNIGRLLTTQEILSKILIMSKTNVEDIKSKSFNSASYLDVFESIFTKGNDLIEQFGKLHAAWNTVTTRLQSAARRSNEVTPGELLNNFVIKHNFQGLMSDMGAAYVKYKLNDKEFRRMDKPCLDVVKISYNCLKVRDKILQEIRAQPFVLKLLDISVEFSKIATTIDTASGNTDKLIGDMTSVIDELIKSSWGVINTLATAQNDNLELPYSVVSFEKRNFKIGEPVTNHVQSSINHTNNFVKSNDSSSVDGDLRSLIEDSLKIRQYHNQLTNKLNLHKQSIKETDYDFSFLNE